MRKIAALFFALMMLSGCAPKVAETPSPAPATPTPTPIPPTSEVVEVVTPTPTMSGYDIPDGYSPTTGRKSSAGYHPVLVSISNESAARPQWNLAEADIVYEWEVEGSLTRLAALFNDNAPDKVGPIRSARVYFFDLAQEWDAVLAHYGGPDAGNGAPAGADIKKKKAALGLETVINGMSVRGPFKRDTSRSGPSNVYASVSALREPFEYQPKTHAMPFDLGGQAAYTGNDVKSVTLELKAAGRVSYAYDEETKLYARSVNGKAALDGVSRDPLAYTNIIVQRAAHQRIAGSSKHIGIELIGEGPATYFIDGKQIEGQWRRESQQDRTHYLDAEGNLLLLQPGKTMIHVVRESTAVNAE